MQRCPSCGRENPDDARFCNACATPLATEEPDRREERKVVTVLFCDLVGSTAQAERMDPEDVRALLSRYHSRVRSELERFGGTVEKFIGDAVMALFGAPTAREDDPERAVRGALSVRVWAREEADVQVRIGITTGETVVALGARPEFGEGMAAGDVVNTAARLQSAAPVNGILVDERTFRATERVIEYATADPVRAKGKSEPVLVWQATQARSRYGVDVRQIGATPLVGREREQRMLSEALDRVEEERSPQLVTLVGVPGIGKSRLVWELFRYAESGTDLVTWRQGRSLPYGEGVAFWAVGEIVKAQAGILETDDVAEADAKLVRAVRSLVADGRDAGWIEQHLRPLLGLGTDAGGDRGETFAAWRRFLESLAELRPLVLVFEDLHFADDGLLDFVDHLADWASGVPLLIVATARPELLTRRPAWGGGKPNAVTISLSPLSDEETARLVHGLLGRSVLDAHLQRTLLERAGGNPLYAEEFARLVETGREPAELPETVQGIVAARLDLLPAEDKRLLQDASVVGKVFWLGALASLDGADAERSRSAFTRSSGRSSCGESGLPRSPGRSSTPSGTSWCATSRTGRSRVPSGPRSIGSRPSGSSRSVVRKTTSSWSLTITSRLSSSPARRARTPGLLSTERAPRSGMRAIGRLPSTPIPPPSASTTAHSSSGPRATGSGSCSSSSGDERSQSHATSMRPRRSKPCARR